jgi:hypothetical protein
MLVFIDSSNEFENGSSRMKNKVTGAKNRKHLVNNIAVTFFTQSSSNFVRMLV